VSTDNALDSFRVDIDENFATIACKMQDQNNCHISFGKCNKKQYYNNTIAFILVFLLSKKAHSITSKLIARITSD
jgi:hypothetical protein